MIKKHISEQEIIEIKAHDNEFDEKIINGITTLVCDISPKTIRNGNKTYRITTSVVVVRFNPNNVTSLKMLL